MQDEDESLVVVAGAAGDIGRATMKEFERRGFRVIGWDKVKTDNADNIEICDLLDDAAVIREVERLQTSTSGQLRHLVVVAGGGDFGEFQTKRIEEENLSIFRAVVDANLTAPFNAIRHTAPLLRRGSGNKSITLLSSLNSMGGYGAPGYSAAKAGLSGLTKALAPGFGTFGVRINVLILGTVKTTSFIESARRRGKEIDFDRLGRAIPMGRTLFPEDVATAIGSVAVEMQALTGADIILDNGQVLNRQLG